MSEEEIFEKYIQCKKNYCAEAILLVADNESEWGNDEDEIILGSNGYGADVIAIVNIKEEN
mgnify:CR=1 FL=1